MNVLLIEDDRLILEILDSYFKEEGFKTYTARNGKIGVERYFEITETEHLDLIILDIMMPEMDGWSVCRKIRQVSDIPIIILTARDDEDDEIYGFELKANDYVKKPFSPQVLVARAKSLIERSSTADNRAPQNAEHILKKGKLEINSVTREIKIDNNVINLTTKEFNILYLLASNEKVVFSRETILNKIWEYDYVGETRIVDNHIKKIRKALGDYSYYIGTIFGVGYKFEVK